MESTTRDGRAGLLQPRPCSMCSSTYACTAPAGARRLGARLASKPARAIASTSLSPSTEAMAGMAAASSRPQNAREPKRLP